MLLSSLNMGCVTFLERYFENNELSEANFNAAIAAAEHEIRTISEQYLTQGWQNAVGASGTVQAMQEILVGQGKDEVITLPRLEAIMQQALACGHMDQLNLPGLAQERKQVFPSGLAILIALFRVLNISGMTLSGGALREGVLVQHVTAVAASGCTCPHYAKHDGALLHRPATCRAGGGYGRYFGLPAASAMEFIQF